MVANKLYFGNKESRFTENNTKVFTLDANGKAVAMGIYCELLAPVMDFSVGLEQSDKGSWLVRSNVEMGDKVFAQKPVHVRKVYKCLEEKNEMRLLPEQAREFFGMMNRSVIFKSSTWVREIDETSKTPDFLAFEKPVCESATIIVARAVISLGTAFGRAAPKSGFLVSEKSREQVTRAAELLSAVKGGKDSWKNYPVAVAADGSMYPLCQSDAVLDAHLVLRRKQHWLGVAEKGLVNDFDLYSKSGSKAKYAVDENLRFCFDKQSALYDVQRAPRKAKGAKPTNG